MTDSDGLDRTEHHAPAPTGPEAVSPEPAAAGPGPLPRPADRAPDRPADGPSVPAGSLVLQTSLFGPLTVPDGAGRAAELEELSRRAAVYATRARGDGTRRAYRSGWRQYEAWCHSLGREPLAADPDTIAMYVVRCADQGFAVSSIRVHLAAIRTAHLLAGRSLDLRHPRLAMVIEGVTRAKGVRPRHQAAPAVPGVLRLMLAKRPSAATPLGARDRAMLLVGFGAALRRSELVALTLGDVTPVPGRGLRVLVRRSKTDQQGQGQEIAVWANPTETGFCPLAALDVWLVHRRTASDLNWTATATTRAERPLFCAVTKTGQVTGQNLSDKAVTRLVKQAALDAGLDPQRYSGHSLRAGLATAAGDQGAGLAELMRQTRHKSTEVALGYLRPADLWRNNVTEGVFRQEGPPDQKD
ncbi:MAG TPA: site-specific integrase [Acetobacteraceae bacterium]|nr:site-specific integrase [Acetobacteraceae bacterium]